MASAPSSTLLSVDIVVPAHNEAAVLAANVGRLHRHLTDGWADPWRITIAQNGSTDATASIADELAASLGVRVLQSDRPGRGRALREAWTTSDASVVAYMDADLSTDVRALPVLLDAIGSGRADVAIGSRLVPGAVVTRGFGREVSSRTYNRLVRTALRAGFRDAQCGFKALRRDLALQLLPHVADDGWFFDTELLVVAQRRGLRIEEVPVTWVEDPDSSVALLPTVVADLKGVVRLARARRPPA
ncbi:dolichyl-phosphate beta-glucosyltransferase [Aquihabitans sp. McL0605]|uniref:dolichyl-phosphate beta-glucosyltransferase n=1 Tax=Aquihabitans sp. McL0605 TaxID=3415671 RepID=UPI003CECFD74